ncbi:MULTISPECIES: glycosyltransferase family 4 protein [unclassified Paenibacillus]|uniref:glycosyltransferase family 4 protein n=1 Tax=Paenibacillus TaxID=44249 RepID=UPI00211974A8|nr:MULTISPECIES: glycosyltransferase family 4 protein [unclassified Paenibacillus]
MSPLKILLATFWPFPHSGGIITYVSVVRNTLESQGHQVDILASHPDSHHLYFISKDPKWNGKSVNKTKIRDFIDHVLNRYFNKHFPHVDPWVIWQEAERYTFELAASLFDFASYDLIHTQDVISTRALSRIKPRHVPIVATVHGFYSKELLQDEDIYNENRRLAKKWWKYLCVKESLGAAAAEQIIIPSQWLAKELSKEIAIPYPRMNIIPYGIDMSSLQHNQPLANDHSGKIVISCIGRLVLLKGHEILINALGLLKEQRHDFICWMIGDGMLKTELEVYAGQKGLSDHIIFMGERNDVSTLLKETDIVVVPSLHDNLPFVVIEAQLAGKPVIASHVGGIPEMIRHRETGLLFEKGSSVELAEQLLELMNNPSLRQQLGGHAQTWGMTQWNNRNILTKTIDIYHRALEQIQTIQPTTDTIPEGEYGLIRQPGIHRDDVESIFRFEVDILFYTRIWKELLLYLPRDYSIPDTAVMKTLANTGLPE